MHQASHWSGLTVADLLALPSGAVAGVEIYNGGTVLDSQKGEAVTHWDELLARGARWWGVAVDDTHWHTLDRGLGWVMTRASDATPSAVLQALVQGHFYATTGPEIHSVAWAPAPGADGATERGTGDLQIEVETSPCGAIYVLGFGARNQFAFDQETAARGTPGGTITHASFRVRPPPPAPDGRPRPAPYLRVQCVDWQRRSAWSNPLFLWD